jgi:phage gp46-like protein
VPFTSSGRDVAMVRDLVTGRFDFDWDATGNPRYSDDCVHRVLSLLLEHRPSPGFPGWWADDTGKRGSLLYTVKNVRRSTPSDVEAFASDALQRAVDEKEISDVVARAFLKPVGRARVEVSWKTPGGRPASVAVALGA